jgi:hypothetical protein
LELKRVVISKILPGKSRTAKFDIVWTAVDESIFRILLKRSLREGKLVPAAKLSSKEIIYKKGRRNGAFNLHTASQQPY